ncbi:hypothetical protein OF83DRAFT_1084076 [Amylostereum chailletii]|nr:hypothetical protein OF83DRAFT_1084076 [Amylostereum chailletii]
MPPHCGHLMQHSSSFIPSSRMSSSSTLCARTEIQELSIRVTVEDPDDNEQLLRFMSKLKSPIETLDVHITSYEDYADPLVALGPLSSSLKMLRLGMVDLRRADVILPKVVTLELEIACMKNIEPLLYSFPNVRRLTLFHGAELPFEEEDEEIRADNQAAQEGRRWQSLDFLGSDLPTLYVFGVSCDVETLNVDGLIDLNALPNLHAVLQDARPSSLTLRVNVSQVHASLMGTFVPPAIPITRLNLTLEFRWEEVSIDVVLDRLYHHLSQYPIAVLDMSLSCSACPCPRGRDMDLFTTAEEYCVWEGRITVTRSCTTIDPSTAAFLRV